MNQNMSRLQLQKRQKYGDVAKESDDCGKVEDGNTKGNRVHNNSSSRKVDTTSKKNKKSFWRFLLNFTVGGLFRFIYKISKFLICSNLFWWFALLFGLLSALFVFKNVFIGHTQDYFALNKIEFDGNEKVPDTVLLKDSNLRYKESVLKFSLNDVKDRLEKVSWVKAAVVQRKLPQKISVRISERVPIAIFQTHHKLYLVDSDGVILDNEVIGRYNNLPIIAGEGAEKEVFQFLKCIDKFPKIRKQLVFAVWVGKRRWNIRINRGVTVKLPERGLLQAFAILDEISDSKGLFNEDIVSLDLRIPDRIVIEKKDGKDGKIKATTKGK